MNIFFLCASTIMIRQQGGASASTTFKNATNVHKNPLSGAIMTRIRMASQAISGPNSHQSAHVRNTHSSWLRESNHCSVRQKLQLSPVSFMESNHRYRCQLIILPQQVVFKIRRLLACVLVDILKIKSDSKGAS